MPTLRGPSALPANRSSPALMRASIVNATMRMRSTTLIARACQVTPSQTCAKRLVTRPKPRAATATLGANARRVPVYLGVLPSRERLQVADDLPALDLAQLRLAGLGVRNSPGRHGGEGDAVADPVEELARRMLWDV